MPKSSKILLKYFLVLAILFLVIFNWGYISWFFNYHTIGDNMQYLVAKTIGQNNISVYFSNMPEWSNLSSTANGTSLETLPLTEQAVRPVSLEGLTGHLTIPSIGADAPIMFTDSKSQSVFASLLKKGVLHFPDSALPDQLGTTIILGHSSPPNWPKINYDSIFNRLEDLAPEDKIIIDFEGKKYQYTVQQTYFVNKGDDLSSYLTFNKSMLLLVSCWPPGHNSKRIVVKAELNNK
ncbi:MAG: sortase [Candidatus Pacebacteria bacterium]|nr:sortase [Candidatus Paceibacterota bacterium]